MDVTRPEDFEEALEEANFRVSQLVADSRAWQENYAAAQAASSSAMREVSLPPPFTFKLNIVIGRGWVNVG